MGFQVKTSDKYEFVDITHQVQQVVDGTGIKEGAVIVFIPHTTAAVMTSEDEPGLKRDFSDLFKEYERRTYQHPDGNAEAHILAGIIGHSRVVPIKEGKLDLGTWQSILLVELDGPRQRRIGTTVLSS